MAKRTPAQKRWQDEHHDYLLEQRRLYVAQHREEILAYQRQWRAANRELSTFYRRVNVANRVYPEKLTIDDLRAVLEASGRKCHWCGKEGLAGRDLTLEHLQPFNRRECLAISCLSCNASRIPTHGPKKTVAEKRESRNAYWREWRLTHREQYLKTARESARRYRPKARAKLKADLAELARLRELLKKPDGDSEP